MPRGNAIEAACWRPRRKPGICLFTFQLSRARLQSGEQVKLQLTNLPLHSWPGVESNRVPACILRAIDHPERLPSPGDRLPPSAANPSARPLVLVAYSLALALSLSRPLAHSRSLSLPPPPPSSLRNLFKKHLFTFRIFRTVLPTAIDETRQRGARRVGAQLELD